MKIISMTEFFIRLGAPLKNPMWSWGSVRRGDGTVFLRVWQDRKESISGKTYYMVHHTSKHADTTSLGYSERQTHIDLIRAGASCYMVICIPENKDASPRKIKSFKQDVLFKGGSTPVVGDDGNLYLENLGGVPFEQVKA